jgi:excisionase family DNA binding protein
MAKRNKILINTAEDYFHYVQAINKKEALTLDEAAFFTSYSQSSLYKMTSSRQIPHSKTRGRLCFHREELSKWMLGNPVATSENLETTANDLLYRNR